MGFLFDTMVTRGIGLLFPGQGAQYVGMGKEWAERFEIANCVFQEADRILGIPLAKYCFEGPEETLTRTLYAQPAIFATSFAIFSVLREKIQGFVPGFSAGLSLGEFTALVAAGSLSFEEGLKLVQKRAEFMEKSASEAEGTMISILGLSQDQCSEIAKKSGAELANLNAPDQFVMSGSVSAVDKAAQFAEAAGAKRVIRLKVGGAFHSSLMQSAKKGLEAVLRSVTIQKPQCIFVPNALAKQQADPEEIRSLLGRQLTSPVRWIETMNYAKNQGISHFVELGPGRVLKGLAKRIDSSLEVFSLEKVSDLEGVVESIEKLNGSKAAV